MKTVHSIDFTQIASIPQLIKDFLNDEIPGFEEFNFNKNNFRRQIDAKKQSYTSAQRETLVNVLKQQFEGIPLSEKQQKNIELLKENETFTVVTGHQLNLFTGPAFFIFKIIQTIKTAEWLSKEFPEQNFVPVFWMATEDHDFEEIDHLKTKNGIYEMKADSGGAVGRILIEDLAFIPKFEAEFKDTVYGTEMIRWMKNAYIAGRTLAEATRILVNQIFAEYGLLILDGDNSELKAQMKRVFEEELLKKQLLNSTQNKVENLKARYGKVQVNPREINLFYLGEKRERIDPNGENFVLSESGRTFTKQEILAELENHPENFSPNALMRPVFQETVLPNTVYIGGNAEIMYWLELKDYFALLNLPFPVLVPRNSMLFLTEKVLGKIEKSGLQIESFFEDFHAVLNEMILKGSNLLDEINENESVIKSSFENLKQKAHETDKTFKNLVAAEEKRQLKSFEKMRKRLLRAEKIKQAERISHLENLYLEVHPQKNWQERVYNFSVFYADLGNDWIRNCYDVTDPEKSKLIITEI